MASAAEVEVEKWLLLGPVPHPLPVFAEAEKGGYDIAKLLEEETLPDARLKPSEGAEVGWFSGDPLVWRARSKRKKGGIALASETNSPAIAWLGSYLSVERWTSAELDLLGDHPRRAWLDGEPVASGEEKEVGGEIKLTPGKHLLLVKTVFDPDREEEWSIGAVLSKEEGEEETPELRVSLDPLRGATIRDILDPPRITSLAVGPGGKEVVVSVTRVVPGTDDSESWIEIRDTTDGTPTHIWRGGKNIRDVAWSPDGRYLSYIAEAPGSKNGGASSLYLYDRDSAKPLLEAVENLNGYLWSPTGKAIVYSTTVKAEKDERGVKLLGGLMDRWATYRDKQFLHIVAVHGGARRRLTSGSLTTEAEGFSADGRRLLFTREVEDMSARPYSRTELWALDLEDFSAAKLRDFAWFSDAVYSPDGKRILVAADATAFGDSGLDLPQDIVPNSYDRQLFIWEPASDAVESLSRDFDPSVDSVFWSRGDGRIYLTATDRDYVRLYCYDTTAGTFTALEAGFDRIRSVDLAESAPLAVGLVSSPWVPEALVAFDLQSGGSHALEHPGEAWFADYRPGVIEEWNFEASNGRTISGRVYLPPAFDRSRKYPAIVYYYGGTSPVTREFGGRYPKEYWASNGYVVYVLQPTGAVGWGQEASATHVNDWGMVTTEEIIEGTERFLAAHPYVDPARVGCIGASYGGFETMLLTTKTDIFAAAVSHAGISSLASYWGEGYWGYSYSAVATADSFPWSSKEIYVERSPLFRADRNRVPILLTHGASDTNVPVGESDAFYIALKLLGKDVEYLRIEGQDHFIVDHAKRLVWSSSIVAWFDRWLKGQPEWWSDLYPSGG
jgi:dipeptidyl aminopeptidase/acylaminoacyl peptidase